MRYLIVVGALLLSGCAGMPPTTPSDVLTKAKEVQAWAVTFCKFKPYLASVISLINAGAGIGVSTIGGAICDAATSIPLADGGTRKIVVNGIVIKGYRVR